MKEMIKKYRGSLISSILIILTEMSQTGAFYQLKSHNFVTFENGHPFWMTVSYLRILFGNT